MLGYLLRSMANDGPVSPPTRQPAHNLTASTHLHVACSDDDCGAALLSRMQAQATRLLSPPEVATARDAAASSATADGSGTHEGDEALKAAATAVALTPHTAARPAMSALELASVVPLAAGTCSVKERPSSRRAALVLARRHQPALGRSTSTTTQPPAGKTTCREQGAPVRRSAWQGTKGGVLVSERRRQPVCVKMDAGLAPPGPYLYIFLPSACRLNAPPQHVHVPMVTPSPAPPSAVRWDMAAARVPRRPRASTGRIIPPPPPPAPARSLCP